MGVAGFLVVFAQGVSIGTLRDERLAYLTQGRGGTPLPPTLSRLDIVIASSPLFAGSVAIWLMGVKHLTKCRVVRFSDCHATPAAWLAM